MTTDTSERGLERLICTALTGHPCDPPLGPTVGEPPARYAGVGWAGGNFHDYDREYCVDLAQLSAFLRATQPEAAESLDLSEASPTRRRFLARLQGEITKRGTIDVLRHGIKHEAHNLDLFYGTPSADNSEAQERFKQKPLHRHPPASLQPRRNPARPRHRPVHQRPASLHLRAKKQPHQTDGSRRSPAVSARPQPTRETVRVRPLRRPLRAGRKRNPLLHPPQRQDLLVPPLQPRLERRRWQPTQSQRAGYRLPVARSAPPREPDQHPRKLRPSSSIEGREDGQEEADPNLAPLPSTRRSAPPANRRAYPRRRPTLPDPTLSRQRQKQLHRLAGPPTNRPRERQRSSLRLNHRRHRPPHPRPPDPRHHQAVFPSIGDGRTRRPLGRPAPIHRERQENHHLDDPEIPLHPRRNRQPAARAALRHHHRRGPFQPRRPHRCRHGAGAL